MSLKRLEKLGIAVTEVKNTDLGLLSALPLRELILFSCSHVSDAGLAHILKLPLNTLDLSGLRQLTG